jgi:SAM-dependent methyltransferase
MSALPLAPVDAFALEPGATYEVVSPPGHPSIERWQPPAHLGRLRPALVLLAGEELMLPPLRITPLTRLRLVFAPALPDISTDGLEIDITMDSDGVGFSVFRAGLRSADAQSAPRTVSLSLPEQASPSSLRIRCLPGPNGDPCADWLALIEVTVGQEDTLDLLAARTFRQLRIDYERQHFAHAYRHPMYVARKLRVDCGIDALIPSERSLSVAGAIENAFDYALARLCARIEHKAPDFERRLCDLAAGAKPRPLRVLSLCTGLGLTEAALFRKVVAPVELTLVDINDDLLRVAESLMPAHARVRRLIADVNEPDALDGDYDIAICVSGIHHVVELGRLFQRVRETLSSRGELWLVGEQIGPSGNRLDGDALARANEVFRELDPAFRKNMSSGQVDDRLDNRDCAEATFEGILSHRIEHELGRWFRVIHVSRRNCFLWRLVGPEYVANYDISSAAHRAQLDRLVEEELRFHMAGGRPTELHGIYAPQRLS